MFPVPLKKLAQEGVNPVAIKYQGMSYTYKPKSSLDKNTTNAISSFKKQLSGKYTSANYAAQFENGKVFYKSLVNDKTYSTVSKAVAGDIAAAQKAMSADVKGKHQHIPSDKCCYSKSIIQLYTERKCKS